MESTFAAFNLKWFSIKKTVYITHKSQFHKVHSVMTYLLLCLKILRGLSIGNEKSSSWEEKAFKIRMVIFSANVIPLEFSCVYQSHLKSKHMTYENKIHFRITDFSVHSHLSNNFTVIYVSIFSILKKKKNTNLI